MTDEQKATSKAALEAARSYIDGIEGSKEWVLDKINSALVNLANNNHQNWKTVGALQDIQDICSSPGNASYEYDPTPTDGEKIGRIQGIAAKALFALTEPFDPAKHLSGWELITAYGEIDHYRKGFWDIRRYADRWLLWSDFNRQRITVALPTAAFFHALCGALNVK